jgi:hypothetical protein
MNTSTSLLFAICLAFYCEMRRQMFTMGMLQISAMNYAWLRLAACNDPEKSPILDLFVFFFSRHRGVCIIMHL